MKIFRWNLLFPAAAVVFFAGVLCVIYMDTYLKKALISGGERVFGAKVEIESVKTKFRGLTVNINGIKIGDKDNEFKNLADIDRVEFELRFFPLLNKKYIIDDMIVEGIKWSTSRKTSCRIPPKTDKKRRVYEKSFASGAMNQFKEKAGEEYNVFPGVKRVVEIQKQIKDFSPQSVVEMTGIQSVRDVQDSYVELMGKYDSYMKTVNSTDVQPFLQKVSEITDLLSKITVKTPDDVKKFQEALEKAYEEKTLTENAYNDLKAVKDGLSNDMKRQKDAFKNINALIDRDAENISDRLSIPSPDFQNTSKMVFGGTWLKCVDDVLYYMDLIRTFIPESNAEAKTSAAAKERMKGSEIEYPVKNNIPKLLIRSVSISGTTGGEGKAGVPVSFSGTVSNISSDQKKTGKSTTFEINGDDTEQKFTITGSFDRLGAAAIDTVSVLMDNIDAARLGVPETDYAPSFMNGKSNLKAEFNLADGDFTGKAAVHIEGLYYDIEYKGFYDINPGIIRHVAVLWQGIETINIEAKLSLSKESGIESEFISDADKKLGQRFYSILNAAIGDVKTMIKKEITQYVNTQRNVLQTEADKYSKQIQTELDPKIKEAQKQNEQIKKLIANKEAELKKLSASLLPPAANK